MKPKPLSIAEFKAMLLAGKGHDDARDHEHVLNACLNWLSVQMVDGQRVSAWRVDTGRNLYQGSDGTWHVGRPYGHKGAADATGIIPGGRRFDFDVKIGKDVLSPEQLEFAAMVRSRGGFYFEVRDCVQSLEDQFAEALRNREIPG